MCAQDEKGLLHPWSVSWKPEEHQQGRNVNHGDPSPMERALGQHGWGGGMKATAAIT